MDYICFSHHKRSIKMEIEWKFSPHIYSHRHCHLELNWRRFFRSQHENVSCVSCSSCKSIFNQTIFSHCINITFTKHYIYTVILTYMLYALSTQPTYPSNTYPFYLVKHFYFLALFFYFLFIDLISVLYEGRSKKSERNTHATYIHLLLVIHQYYLLTISQLASTHVKFLEGKWNFFYTFLFLFLLILNFIFISKWKIISVFVFFRNEITKKRTNWDENWWLFVFTFSAFSRNELKGFYIDSLYADCLECKLIIIRKFCVLSVFFIATEVHLLWKVVLKGYCSFLK